MCVAPVSVSATGKPGQRRKRLTRATLPLRNALSPGNYSSQNALLHVSQASALRDIYTPSRQIIPSSQRSSLCNGIQQKILPVETLANRFRQDRYANARLHHGGEKIPLAAAHCDTWLHVMLGKQPHQLLARGQIPRCR